MDIVLVTRDRAELTAQTIRSMRENAADWSKHRLVVVLDGTEQERDKMPFPVFGDGRGYNVIPTGKQLGVGGAKNYGADWLSRQRGASVRREAYDEIGELLMFSDNDMYYLPGWDAILESAARGPSTQMGGWRHPFHALGHFCGTLPHTTNVVHEVDAVTGNCFVIRWSDWLRYGPFDANAIGPGQSEDYAFSQRIKASGGLCATLDPPVAIHCGLVNSAGEPATGWREMATLAREQLRAMPEQERRRVVLEVPQWPERAEVFDILADIQPDNDPNPTVFVFTEAADREIKVQGDSVGFTGLRACGICGPNTCSDPVGHERAYVPIESSQYAPGSQIGARDVIPGPVAPVGLRREITVDEAREMFPARAELRCVDCDRGLGGEVFYGAGDGTGQRFRCVGCHSRTEEEAKAKTQKLEVLQKLRDGGAHPFEALNVLGVPNVGAAPSDAEQLADRLNDAAVAMGFVRPVVIDERPVGLNVGSGQRRFESTPALAWINIDAQNVPPDRVPDMVCDVGRERLHLPDGCAQYVVLHQVLEHFGCGEATPMLRECWRVLAPGGSLIVTVPDMRVLAGRWLGGELDTQVYLTACYGAYMGDEHDRHRWGFTAESLRRYLVDTFMNKMMDHCDGHAEVVAECGPCTADVVRPFDWRPIPGASIARDFWILGIEVVKS